MGRVKIPKIPKLFWNFNTSHFPFWNFNTSHFPVSTKTKYAIYKMEQGDFQPLIYDDTLNLTKYTFDDIKLAYRECMPSELHSLRRSLYEENEKNYDVIF